MNKKTRSLLSFLLTIAMIFSCFSASAFSVYADGDAGTEEVVEEILEAEDEEAEDEAELVVEQETEETDPVVEQETEETDSVVEQETEETDPVVEQETEGTDPAEKTDERSDVETGTKGLNKSTTPRMNLSLTSSVNNELEYEAEQVKIVLTTYAAVAAEDVEVETAIASLTLSDGTVLKDSNGWGYSVDWDYTVEGLTAAGFGVHYVTVSGITKTETYWNWGWKTDIKNYTDASVAWYICSDEVKLTKGTNPSTGYFYGSAEVLYSDPEKTDAAEVVSITNGVMPVTGYNYSEVTAENKGVAVVKNVRRDTGDQYTLYTVQLRQLEEENAKLTLEQYAYIYSGTSYSVTPEVVIPHQYSRDEVLEEDEDYVIVSGGDAVYPGKHTVKIQGIGDFEGELTADWYICSRAQALGAATTTAAFGKASVVLSSGAFSISSEEDNLVVSAEFVQAKYKTIPYFGKVKTADEYYKDGEAVICVEHTIRWPWWDFTRDEYIYVKVKPQIEVEFTADAVPSGSGIEYNVSWLGNSLKKNTDYTVSGDENAAKAGRYLVTIEGTGDYSGRIEYYWYAYSSVMDVYSGQSHEFEGWDKVKEIDGTVLDLSGNAEVETSNKTDPCYIKVSGEGPILIHLHKDKDKGSHAKDDYIRINVERQDIANVAKFDVSPEIQIYDGIDKTVTVDVVSGSELELDADYSVTGTTAKKGGKYNVTVTGEGDYKGTTVSSWYIADEVLVLDDIKASKSYWGGTPEIIKGDGFVNVTAPVVWSWRPDYNGYITAEATGAALVKVDYGWAGSKYIYVLVNPQMSDVTVSLTPASYVYDGNEKRPKYTLTYGIVTLEEGKDFTVSGTTQAAAVDKYDVTFTGREGRFDGEKTVQWNITEADLSKAEISYTVEADYNRQLQTVTGRALTVTLGGTSLIEGTDFIVEKTSLVKERNASGAIKATDAGTYYFDVVGMGNYTGSAQNNKWTINKLPITPKDIDWCTTSFEYNRAIKEYSVNPVVTVAGMTLVADTDFILIEAKASGIGNYNARIETKPYSNFVVWDSEKDLFNPLDSRRIISQDWNVAKVVSVATGSSVRLGDAATNAWKTVENGKPHDRIANIDTRYEGYYVYYGDYVEGQNLGTAKFYNIVKDYDVIVKVLPQDYYTDKYFSLSPAAFTYDGTQKTVKVMCTTSNGIDSYTENVDYTVEGTLSATAVGTYCVTVSAITPNSGFAPLSLSWTISEAPQAPVYYSAPDPTINVPVSGEEGSTKISGTMSGTTLTVKDFNQGTEKEVLGEDVKTGMIKIEADNLGKTVNSIVLPQAVVQKIADAIEDENNDAEGFSVALSNATVEFDSQAALAIAKNVPEKDKLSLNVNTNSTLNNAQKIAIEGLDTEIVLDIYLTSNNQRITDFEGGTAKISIPYTLKDGQDPSGVSVWYVSETGEKEELACKYADGCVVFEVMHFSNYVVMWNTECPKDERCPLSEFTDLDPDADYHDGVHFCLTNEYMLGCGNGTFKPEDFETKAQLATVLYRIAQDEGRGFAGAWMFYPDCADAGSIPEYAYEGVCWLYMNGILEKDAEGSLNINEGLTREEFVTVLYKFADFMGYDLGDYADSSLPAVEWADAEAILDDEKYKIEKALKVCRGEGASAVQAFLASCVR